MLPPSVIYCRQCPGRRPGRGPILVVVTEWNEFRAIAPERLREAMAWRPDRGPAEHVRKAAAMTRGWFPLPEHRPPLMHPRRSVPARLPAASPAQRRPSSFKAAMLACLPAARAQAPQYATMAAHAGSAFLRQAGRTPS